MAAQIEWRKGLQKMRIDAKLDALPAKLLSHFLLTRLCNNASSAKSRSSLTRASVIVKCPRTDKFRPIQSTLVPRMPFRKDNGNPEAVKSRTKHATRLFLRISHHREWVIDVGVNPRRTLTTSPPSHKQACTSRIANDITPVQANGPLREP